MGYGVCEFLGYTHDRKDVWEYRSYGHTYWTVGGKVVNVRPIIAYKRGLP